MKLADKKPVSLLLNALSQGAGGPLIPKKLRQNADELRGASSQWLRYNGIQGLSIGYKETAHQKSDVVCLKLLVEKKKPKGKLRNPAPQSIQSLDGKREIPVDVEEVGRLMAHNGTLFPGASIAHERRNAGTLGIVVNQRNTPERKYLLSCRHVIAPFNLESLNRDVCHPAPQDGGNSAIHKVAEYVAAFPRFFDEQGFPNLADAALARLSDGIAWRNDIPVIGQISGIANNIKVGDYVRIYGRTSGYSIGQILHDSANIYLGFYRQDGSWFRLGFYNQIECSPYAKGGDSGAAVVDAQNRLVGLHIGGSNNRSYFSPIKPILDYFQVVVSQAGGVLNNLNAEAEETDSDKRFVTKGISQPHTYHDSISWALTPEGLQVGSEIETSEEYIATASRVWSQFSGSIIEAANRFDVPAELIIATICTESGGDHRALRKEPGYLSDSKTPGKVSAGLMQTLISTANDALDISTIDREWLFVPINSITAGTAYISQQRLSTNLDPPLVASAYNACGISWNNSPKNRWKTRQYAIGTSQHVDRFVLYFNGVFRLFRKLSTELVPECSFYQDFI